MKIAAAPLEFGFDDGEAAADLEVILYGHPDVPRRAGIGSQIPDIIRRRKWRPTNRAWDFLSIALAVEAVDISVARGGSTDGWTRQLDLAISVIDPDFWSTQTSRINKMLRFLTTDIWNVSFQPGGLKPPPTAKVTYPQEDCVSLLSGGLDSLVGGIDLTKSGLKPLFVSQVSNGDKEKQTYFAKMLNSAHFQLNHVADSPESSERSQRARSIVFFAYGVLAATSFLNYVKGITIPLYVCENGLISINPSLTPMRLGSLSTRTTHPVYLAGIQEILQNAGIDVTISNPYQFATKGEMLKNCTDQTMLSKLASQSTSCGRFARNGFKHCGRCVPCIIRRASFHAWGQKDLTIYRHQDLGKDDNDHAGFDDVRALRMAGEIATSKQFDGWVGASLASTLIGDPAPYKATVSRGLQEVKAFLVASGVK
jgi:hypothetical protein